MLQKIITALKFTFLLAVMAFLLYFSFENIDEESLNGRSKWQFVMDYVSEVNPFFTLLSIIFALSSHWIRALRWRLVLEPIGYKVSAINATMSVLHGYFFNLFVPRSGEITRPNSLQRTEGVPTDIGIGTVVTERIIDLMFLLLCISAVLYFQSDIIFQFINDGKKLLKPEVASSSKGIWLMGGVLLSIVVVIFFVRKIGYEILIIKVKSFTKGMWEGLISIRLLQQRSLFVFYSVLIWVLYFLMLYAMFLAFPQTNQVSLENVLTIFVVGGMAQVMPLPGGSGAYHVMVSYALSKLIFIPLAVATAIVTIVHGIQTVVLILAGAVAVIWISKNQKNGNKV